MKIKPVFCIIAILALITVAVPELTGSRDVPRDRIIYYTDMITEGLVENPSISGVVDYNRIAEIQKQHRFEASDWSNTAKYAEIGRAFNVDTIAVGNVIENPAYARPHNFDVTIQLIDINTFAVVGAGSNWATVSSIKVTPR